MAGISYVINGLKRVAKVLPDLVLGNGAEVAGGAIKTAMKNKKSIFTAAKEGVKAVESAGKGLSFWSRITSNIGLIKSMPIDAIKTAGTAGKGFFGKAWAGIKGFGKGIGKNMPLIGALMTIAFEIPNVVKATKEQGIGQGVKEVGKAAARLCGGGLGAAVGSAFFPPIGTIVGWMVGEWAVSKVVGKSYTEKVMQAEYEAQALAEQQAQQQAQFISQQPAFQGNPYQQQVQPQVTYTEPVDYYQQAQVQAQPQVAQQPVFQGNPYIQENSALSNPFAQQTEFNNLTNMMGGNTLDNYSNDIFARNIDFNQLALNMTNGITSQTQMQQPLQMKPQMSIINP